MRVCAMFSAQCLVLSVCFVCAQRVCVVWVRVYCMYELGVQVRLVCTRAYVGSVRLVCVCLACVCMRVRALSSPSFSTNFAFNQASIFCSQRRPRIKRRNQVREGFYCRVTRLSGIIRFLGFLQYLHFLAFDKVQTILNLLRNLKGKKNSSQN